MVHQHFTLAENLQRAREHRARHRAAVATRLSAAAARAKRLHRIAAEAGLRGRSRRAGFATLSVGEKQRVEILKALYRGARVLILDEPTAVLTPQRGRGAVRDGARRSRRAGLPIIFISHKLAEVIALCRSHRRAARRPQGGGQAGAAASTARTLADLMVGRRSRSPKPERRYAPATPVLRSGACDTRRASAVAAHCATCSLEGAWRRDRGHRRRIRQRPGRACGARRGARRAGRRTRAVRGETVRRADPRGMVGARRGAHPGGPPPRGQSSAHCASPRT